MSKKPKVELEKLPFKRPSSAYVYFSREVGPTLSNRDGRSRFMRIGELWRELGADQRKAYEDMAAKDKFVVL